MTDCPDTPESLRALAGELWNITPDPSQAPAGGGPYQAKQLDLAEAALRRAADRMDRVAALALPLDLPEAARDALAAWLQDSALVRVNILTGRIAKPDDLVWLHDTNGPVADALAGARRSGAEEMRERTVRWLRSLAVPDDGSVVDKAVVRVFLSIADGVADLPLSERKP